MTAMPHVLVFDDAPRLGHIVSDALNDRGYETSRLELGPITEGQALRGADLAVVVLDPYASGEKAPVLLETLEQLNGGNLPTLVWGMPESLGRPTGPMLDCLSPDTTLEDVLGRLAMLGRYAPLVRRLDRELVKLQRLGNQLNKYFSEIDQELRLAGRLQRDFLPAKLPHVAPLTFATLYRPASWVSGDMYDVFRIDEQHLGMFMTDAMGHGIAAGLLTMFLRQALVVKRITGQNYQIVGPAEAMAHLNNCLVRQKLPNCQFVTAAYGIIDVDTLELRVARGGHPNPIHIRRDGTIGELPAPGGLLGIADLPPDFGELRVRLQPGDKVLFYTDGVQDDLIDPEATEGDNTVYTEQFQTWAREPVHGMLQQIGAYLDAQEGSLNPADDVTILAVEVTE